MKKIGDLLGMGLFCISIYIITQISGVFTSLGKIYGLVGGVITLIVEGWYLLNYWRKR